MSKRISRELRIGDVIIGDGRLPVLQSMCSTDTRDIAATAAQMASVHHRPWVMPRMMAVN